MRTEIRIAGFGGQGILMCGIVIAKAASLFDHIYAVQTQSYGPEARGGASRTEVVISDDEIDYPKVESPEIFVVMSHESLLKYIDDIQENATLIIDPDLVYEEEINDIKRTIYPQKAKVILYGYETGEKFIYEFIESNNGIFKFKLSLDDFNKVISNKKIC